MRAIRGVHLHEGAGAYGLVGRLVDDVVVHGEVRHEIALAVAELGTLLVGMDVGFEVEACVGGLQAHAGRFHVDRLEVHGVDGQRADFLVGMVLIDLDLLEARAGIAGAGVVGTLGLRRGGAGLAAGCGIVGIAACGQGEGHGACQQDAEQGSDLLILHCVLFLFFGSLRNVGNL